MFKAWKEKEPHSHFYFPISRKELAKDKFSASLEDYMGKGETILVVDDVEEQRENSLSDTEKNWATLSHQ